MPETFFFRYYAQFQTFIEVALRDRLKARSSERYVNVLSAGCSTGEEPYSLAILMRAQQPLKR